MTRPSAPYGIPDPAPLGEGSEVAPGRAGELPGRHCVRCGAVGTHYLTCPGLRLPLGYRLSGAPAPVLRCSGRQRAVARVLVDDAATVVLVIACIVVPGQIAVFWLGWRSGRRVGHRGELCITRRISPGLRTAAGRHRGGPDHPDWPCLPRH
jgi:hypothetical protein